MTIERKRVGITGSRDGMTDAQERTLVQFFAETPMSEFHQGCCVGVDTRAFWLLFQLGGGVQHAHPPTDEKAMDASCRDNADVVHEPKLYLDRNRDIVDAVDMMLVVPKQSQFMEHGGGGTWSTFRYARERVPCLVIWPDGTETLTTPTSMR